MKKIAFLIAFLVAATALFSQTLHWNPVSSTTSGSMVLIAKIQVNGVDQASDQLELGVFCGDECRGACIAHLFTYVQPNYHMVDPMVYGDVGDMFTFKLYDHAIGQELVLDSPEALAFDENGEGNPMDPLILNFTDSVTEEYTVTALANPAEGGAVTGTGSYPEGETCTLTATANAGYYFYSWTKDGVVVSYGPDYTFTVTESGIYIANFIQFNYTVSVAVAPPDGGTALGGGVFPHGSTATVGVILNPHYSLECWSLNGEIVSEDPVFSFEVTGNCMLIAHLSFFDDIEENNDPALLVYPNPTPDRVIVSGEGIRTVNIYDVTGKLVMARGYDHADRVEVDLDHLNPGVYFLSIALKGSVVNKTVIKE